MSPTGTPGCPTPLFMILISNIKHLLVTFWLYLLYFTFLALIIAYFLIITFYTAFFFLFLTFLECPTFCVFKAYSYIFPISASSKSSFSSPASLPSMVFMLFLLFKRSMDFPHLGHLKLYSAATSKGISSHAELQAKKS